MVPILTLNSQHLTLLNWQHKFELEDGIRTMYEWYLESSIK